MKLLCRIIKIVINAVIKLAKAIWNIIVKLFHKLKKKRDKVFVKEPPGLQPQAPTPKMPKTPTLGGETEAELLSNKLKLKEKKGKKFKQSCVKIKRPLRIKKKNKRESFLWKIFKKGFKMFLKLIGKLISKLFTKIIKKLINTVVKIIVRFVIMQIIGSLIPGLGNAFALAMTAINAIMLIGGAVMFIKGLSDMVSDMNSGLDEGDDDEPEEPDEDDEEEKPKRKKTAYEHLVRMRELEKEGKIQDGEYMHAKQQYMMGLLEQAEKTGNIAEMKALKEAMGIPLHKNSSNATPSFNAIKEVDLTALQNKFNENVRTQFYERQKINKTQIMGPTEIEEVLIGAEGEPDWLIFWRQQMVFIEGRIKDRLKKSRYTIAMRNAAMLALKDEEINILYKIDDYKHLYTAERAIRVRRETDKVYGVLAEIKKKEEQRLRMISNGELGNGSFFDRVFDYFRDSDITEDTIKAKILVEENTTDLYDETRELRYKSLDSNWAQRDKLKRFIEIRNVLRYKNN